MPSVASPPLCGVTLRSLRDLTRLAVTALVLTAGLNSAAAAAAAPAPSAPVLDVRPAAVTGPVEALHPGRPSAGSGSSTYRAAACPTTLTAPVERDAVATAPRPRADRPDAPPATAPVVVRRLDLPPAQPTRNSANRRGPPTA